MWFTILKHNNAVHFHTQSDKNSLIRTLSPNQSLNYHERDNLIMASKSSTNGSLSITTMKMYIFFKKGTKIV